MSQRQNFRIFIHGHSYRHVYGCVTQREVTDWIVKLCRGQQPPHASYAEWGVERRIGDEWRWLNDRERRALIAAVRERVQAS